MDDPGAAFDARARRLDRKARRLGVAILAVAVGSVLYLVVLIAVLSQLRTPLPGWLFVVVVPLAIPIVAIPVLRSLRNGALADAVLARVRAAQRAIDELEAEQGRAWGARRV